MRSASLMIPTRLPASSTTGSALIRFASSISAISFTETSGWTVMTFVTMTSAAFILLLRSCCVLQKFHIRAATILISINALITVSCEYFLMKNASRFKRVIETIGSLVAQPRFSRFACGDCDRNAQCGLPPHDDCIFRLMQIARDGDPPLRQAVWTGAGRGYEIGRY